MSSKPCGPQIFVLCVTPDCQVTAHCCHASFGPALVLFAPFLQLGSVSLHGRSLVPDRPYGRQILWQVLQSGRTKLDTTYP